MTHRSQLIVRAAVVAAATLFTATAIAQHVILKSEPAMGTMKQGQIVYVDDGRCGKGKIRRVSGGDHVKAGGTKNVKRQSECVARPE